MKITNIPKEILIKYKLYDIVNNNGSVYMQDPNGMYSLP